METASAFAVAPLRNALTAEVEAAVLQGRRRRLRSWKSSNVRAGVRQRGKVGRNPTTDVRLGWGECPEDCAHLTKIQQVRPARRYSELLGRTREMELRSESSTLVSRLVTEG